VNAKRNDIYDALYICISEHGMRIMSYDWTTGIV